MITSPDAIPSPLSYEQRHIARTNFWFLVVYWLHVPALAVAAVFLGKDAVTTLALASVAVVGPQLLYWLNRSSIYTASSMGVAGIALSAVLIHVGGGMIEMHFHIFVLLPLLAFFGNPWVVVAGAATAAVHHLSLYYFLPTSLFNYQASLWIVVLHATFVVLATVPGILLANLIRSYVIGTGAALTGLNTAGEELDVSSRELAAASDALAREANGQAASVQQMSATLNEIEARSSEVSKSLGRTRDQQLGQLRDVLTRIEDAGSRLSTTISGIRESNEAITTIAKNIEEISFQTNILALNAAVEAARAGEAGAGFAVVASEVRALAGRAAASARETSELIESATERSRAGESVSAEVADHLAQVLSTFRDLDGIIRKAAAEVEEQSRGVSTISTAMQQVDASAQSGSARSEQLSATAATLREQSTMVSHSIATLTKVTQGGTARPRAASKVQAPAIRPAPAPARPRTPSSKAELSFR